MSVGRSRSTPHPLTRPPPRHPLPRGRGLPPAHRAEIVVAPGISAMQAAAARAGAPLGHDFCAISLSDLLTPWETIEARIRAAAEGDFVIAFYNPVSERRRTQLAAAKQILLEHRSADTPVVLARNLGRDGESVTTIRLADLDVDDGGHADAGAGRRIDDAAGRGWRAKLGPTRRAAMRRSAGPLPPCGGETERGERRRAAPFTLPPSLALPRKGGGKSP